MDGSTHGVKKEMEPIFPWLVTVFVGGLILGSWVHLTLELWAAASVVLGTLVAVRYPTQGPKARIVFTSLFFLLGALHGGRILPTELPDDHVARWAGRRVSLEGVFIRAPERRAHSVRLLMEVVRVYEGRRARKGVPARGRLLLTVGKGGERWLYGDVIRVRCIPRIPPDQANPGTFHWRRYLALKGIYATAFIPGDDFILLIRHGGRGTIRGCLESIRSRLASLFAREFPTPAKELLMALVLGEGGALGSRWREVFASLGVSHLLAISGLHVGIVALFVFAVVRRVLLFFPALVLRLPVEKVSWGLAIPIMLLYGGIAGFGTSTVRSLFMGCFLAAALLWDRLRRLPHALSVAALGILLIRPESIYELSFQLSFLAVMGILYAVPLWMEALFPGHPLDRLEPYDRRRRFFRSVVGLGLCSTAAFLATLPLVLIHFHRLPWAAIAANVVLVPIVGLLVLPLALTGSALSLVWPAGGVEILWVCAWLLTGIVQAMSMVKGLLGEGIFLPAPRPWEVAIFYGIFVCLCHFRRVPWTRWAALGLSAILLVIWGIEGLMREWDPTLKVHCISVGNGSAVLVEGPHGYRMVVDAGGLTRGGRDLGELEVAPVLWHRRILRLHRVILSHPHPDHAAGLTSILRRFSVGELWWNGVVSPTETFQRLKEAAALKGLPVRALHRGVDWNEGPLRIEVLSPPQEGPLLMGRTPSARMNNSSAVLRLSMGAVSFLIPGDIEKEAEAWLCRRGGIRSTVLVAPHHGSRTSSSEAFLRAVRPRCVVFSTKAGSGGLLSPIVRRRYRRLGVETFHTGEDGMVSFVTDGRGLLVETHRSRRRKRIHLVSRDYRPEECSVPLYSLVNPEPISKCIN